MKDNLPQNEDRRLAELLRYEILDTAEDPAFDRICGLARDLLQVPIAAITLQDAERCWFKAASGVPRGELPRRASLCDPVVSGGAPVLVGDTLADERYRGLPLVTGPAAIRFYAGMPLQVGDGLTLGALCVADVTPRELSATQLETLTALAELTVAQLRLHHTHLELQRELEARNRSESDFAAQSRELQLRENLLAQTARIGRIGGWIYEVESGRATWSDEVYRIHEIAEGRPATLEDLTRRYPRSSRERLCNAMRKAVVKGVPFDLELPFVASAGERRWVRALGEVEREGDRIARIVGTFQDVSDRKAAEASIAWLARHDSLTGLPNRALFQDRLDEATRHARRDGTKVALLLLDLDNFKDVNDTLGHDAGDALLRAVAARVRAAVGTGDTVARLGGDEFAVIVPGLTDSMRAQRIAHDILARLRDPVDHAGISLEVGASVGVTVYPDDDQHSHQLMKNVDIALYRAKAAGRGRAVLFTQGMRRTLERRLKLASEVRQGLRDDAFLLHYQPTVSLRTGAVTGFEALLRWRHPELGIVGPATFMAAFDDHDLALALGSRVLDLAIGQIRAWIDAGVPAGRIAVNLAAAQFRAGDLAEQVQQRLDSAGVSGDRLALEVTESVFLGRSSENIDATLRRLAALGARISLDDFGTGYASLSHLKQFPVDQIKIDRSFVQDIGHDADDGAIVRAVAQLGHSLGLDVVAEGVETRAQVEFLRDCGCPHAQGFYFSRAIPPSDVGTFLAEWNDPFEAGRQVA